MANRNALVSMVLCVALAACTENPAATEAPPTFTPALSYGSPGCFPGLTATQVCQALDGPSATATGYCLYDDCFEITYGELVKVVAADEQGEFPSTWFAWGDATLTATGLGQCLLQQEGKKKTRVDIPADKIRCKAVATVGDYLYNEHFASNPASQCLGWIECKLPVLAGP
jgi:hypothetical protein